MRVRWRLKAEPAGLEPTGRKATAPGTRRGRSRDGRHAQPGSRGFTPRSLHPHKPNKMGTLIIPKLQMSQLRHREVKVTFPKLLYK